MTMNREKNIERDNAMPGFPQILRMVIIFSSFSVLILQAFFPSIAENVPALFNQIISMFILFLVFSANIIAFLLSTKVEYKQLANRMTISSLLLLAAFTILPAIAVEIPKLFKL